MQGMVMVLVEIRLSNKTKKKFMKKQKTIELDDSGRIKEIDLDEGRLDWIREGRLRKQAAMGNKKAQELLEVNDKHPLIFFTEEEMDAVQKTVEMEQQAENL